MASPVHSEVLLHYFHQTIVEPCRCFPLLLESKPSSAPWPHAVWPCLPHLEPCPFLISFHLCCPLQCLGSAKPFPTSGHLPVLLIQPGSLLPPALLTTASSFFGSRHKCHLLMEAFPHLPTERRLLSLFSIQLLFAPSHPYCNLQSQIYLFIHSFV